MLSTLRAHLTYANVASSLALFIALAGGTAWAVDEWTGANIQDGTLTSADYKNNDIRSSDVRNFQLNDEDISQGTFTFEAQIGNVSAHSCVDALITGANAQGDHLLLTPNYDTASPLLHYSILYRESDPVNPGSAMIRACNPFNGDTNDGTTKFNLLVIDAQ